MLEFATASPDDVLESGTHSVDVDCEAKNGLHYTGSARVYVSRSIAYSSADVIEFDGVTVDPEGVEVPVSLEGEELPQDLATYIEDLAIERYT